MKISRVKQKNDEKANSLPLFVYFYMRSHTRTIPEKLLVYGFRVILLCLYELVVEVNIISLALFQLPCGQQAIEQLRDKLVCRVEVVGLALVGRVG